MRSAIICLLLVLASLPFTMGSGCGGSDDHQYYSDYCEGGDLSDCTSDEQCDDHVFCNGIERCDKSLPGADVCGCAHAPTPACSSEQVCIEGTMRCESPACADADGDGHHAAACGGDDCDDNDGNRFPGNPEVCDAAGHDEDCDGGTFGLLDADGDQFYAATCCNTDSAGTHCGTDCDDTNPAIVPGAQKCVKNLSTTVLICQKEGTFTAPVDCGGSLSCIVQPNGLGVCE